MSSNRAPTPRTSCGAASVEAVVALPVLVILFLGMCFVRSLTATKLVADQEARRCAWAYAMQNCEIVPAGCEEVLSAPHTGNPDPSLEREFEKATQSMTPGKGAQAVTRLLTEMVLSAIAQAFTKKFEATKAIERERPPVFGAGPSRIVGKYRLPCNLKPQTQEDLVKQAWHKMVR